MKTLNASDEVFLVEFSDEAKLAVRLTENASEIENRLTLKAPAALTALLDAVHVGLQEMKNAKNPRKALLIISDGGDNNSRYTATEIENLVREADVQIYAMGIFEPYLGFGLTARKSAGLACYRKSLSRPADGRSPRITPTNLPPSPTALDSNCATNICWPIHRRIKTATVNIARCK